MWNGKTIYYIGGKPPNDRGVVINSIFNLVNAFMAIIYRADAPIDGKEVFVIDYKEDRATSFITDYIRQVGDDLYLGMMALRIAPSVPVLFFMLDGTPAAPDPNMNQTIFWTCTDAFTLDKFYISWNFSNRYLCLFLCYCKKFPVVIEISKLNVFLDIFIIAKMTGWLNIWQETIALVLHLIKRFRLFTKFWFFSVFRYDHLKKTSFL